MAMAAARTVMALAAAVLVAAVVADKLAGPGDAGITRWKRKYPFKTKCMSDAEYYDTGY